MSSDTFPRLFWLLVAAFVGFAAGSIFFPCHPADAKKDAGTQDVLPKATPAEPGPQPRVLVEAQIARKAAAAVRTNGQHRFALVNVGNATLRLAPGPLSNSTNVYDFPHELTPGKSGYITVSWPPLPEGVDKPWPKVVQMQTNDVREPAFFLVIVEDSDGDSVENADLQFK